MRMLMAILRGAAWLVPGDQRAEWLAEWRAELWYVRERSNRKDAMAFCLGAFPDALWLRRNSPPGRKAGALDSPVVCILSLGALAAASLFFALRLPGAREMILPSYPDAENLANDFN